MAIKPCFRQNLGIQGHNLEVILKLKGKPQASVWFLLFLSCGSTEGMIKI